MTQSCLIFARTPPKQVVTLVFTEAAEVFSFHHLRPFGHLSAHRHAALGWQNAALP